MRVGDHLKARSVRVKKRRYIKTVLANGDVVWTPSGVDMYVEYIGVVQSVSTDDATATVAAKAANFSLTPKIMTLDLTSMRTIGGMEAEMQWSAVKEPSSQFSSI